jgi:hypothetical protein
LEARAFTDVPLHTTLPTPSTYTDASTQRPMMQHQRDEAV